METDQKQKYINHLEKLERMRDNSYHKSYKSLSRVLKRPPLMAPLEAIRLAGELRKAAADHKKAPWLIVLVIAISCDCMDTIPIAGWIVSLFFKPLLFLFLWGKGSWRIRTVYYICLLIDFFPFINMLPLSTACVVYAYMRSKRKIENDAKILEEISEGKFLPA